MTKSLVIGIAATLLVLGACKKDEPEPYLRHIRYEVSCDSCQAQYLIGEAELFTQVDGFWQRTWDIHESQYLYLRLAVFDTTNASTAKIFINDQRVGGLSGLQAALVQLGQ